MAHPTSASGRTEATGEECLHVSYSRRRNDERDPVTGRYEPVEPRAWEIDYCLIPVESWRKSNVDEDRRDPVVQAVCEWFNLRTPQYVEDMELEFDLPATEYFSRYAGTLERQNAFFEHFSKRGGESMSPFATPEPGDGLTWIDDDGDTVTEAVYEISQGYTYNWETDLSSDIHYVTFQCNGEHYIIAAKHVGMDARVGFEDFCIGRVMDYYAAFDMSTRYCISVVGEVPDGIDAAEDVWTDPKGVKHSRMYCDDWSASQVCDFLHEQGIHPVFPDTDGYGDTIPVTNHRIPTTHPNVFIDIDIPCCE